MRWLSGLLAIAIVFFVGQTCTNEHADIKLVFSVAAQATSAKAPIASFDATVLSVGEDLDDLDEVEVVAEMTRKLGPASGSAGSSSQREVASWEFGLDPGLYRLELTMTDAAGNQWHENRTIEAIPRGTIRMTLPERPSPKDPAAVDE